MWALKRYCTQFSYVIKDLGSRTRTCKLVVEDMDFRGYSLSDFHDYNITRFNQNINQFIFMHQ